MINGPQFSQAQPQWRLCQVWVGAQVELLSWLESDQWGVQPSGLWWDINWDDEVGGGYHPGELTWLT